MNARQDSLAKLKQIREAGIKFVQVLGSGLPGEDCEACLAMKGVDIEIEFATPLPLAGCSRAAKRQSCKCIILASRGSETL